MCKLMQSTLEEYILQSVPFNAPYRPQDQSPRLWLRGMLGAMMLTVDAYLE